MVSADTVSHTTTRDALALTRALFGGASPRLIIAARRRRAKRIAEVRMIVWVGKGSEAYGGEEPSR
jgi:hypothetical protein